MESAKDGPYLFTFSPKSLFDYNKLYMKVYSDVSQYFKSFWYCMDEFEINPELNANGGLHYHGYFIIKDRVKYFKSCLPTLKRNGMVRVEKIKHDFDKAVLYSRKDRTLMESLLKRTSIVLPIIKTEETKKYYGIGCRMMLDVMPSFIDQCLVKPDEDINEAE